MNRIWSTNIISRKRNVRARRPAKRSMRLESLESRSVPAVLLVPAQFSEIQDAVDAADPGDIIKVASGTYEPFTVDKDNLTIREATTYSNPVIDATGTEIGVQIDADGVTVQGLTVENAEQLGFLAIGNRNTLRDNTARDIGPEMVAAGSEDLDGSAVQGFLVDGDRNTLRDNTAENIGIELVVNAGAARGFQITGDLNNLRGNTSRYIGAELEDANTEITGGSEAHGFEVIGNRNILNDNIAEYIGRNLLVDNVDAHGFQITGDLNNLRDNTAWSVGPELDGEFPNEGPPPPSFFFQLDAFGFLITGDRNKLSENTAASIVTGFSSNRGDGFVLSEADYSKLIGNLAEDNGSTGFVLRQDSDGNVLKENTAINNPTGFNVGGEAPGAIGGLGGGPPNQPSDYNRLDSNTATGYDTGFYVSGTSQFVQDETCGCFRFVYTPAAGTSFASNDAVHPSGFSTGFSAFNTEGTRLSDNYTSDNGGDGFEVRQSTNAIIVDNISWNNEGSGYDFAELTGSTVNRNSAIGNGEDGFFLGGGLGESSNNRFESNRALDNGRDGFRLVSTPLVADDYSQGFPPVQSLAGIFETRNNTFKDNTAMWNAGVGFHLIAATGNELVGNVATRNGSDGFRIAGLEVFASSFAANADEFLGSFSSDSNILRRNVAEHNRGYGYYVDEVLSNLFFNNEAEDNTSGGSNLPGILGGDDD